MATVRIKRSNTSSATPASLADGEIAINQADGRLYYHTAAGGVGSIASSGGGSYTLPTATSSVLGGVKIGSGVSIDGNGVISVASSSYTLPTASASTLGGVQVGSGLSISGGVLSVATAGGMNAFVRTVLFGG